MAKTTEMRLLEFMVLKQDIKAVIEYLGKKGTFQFQTKANREKKGALEDAEEETVSSTDILFYEKLSNIANSLNIELPDFDITKSTYPSEKDQEEAGTLIAAYDELQERINEAVSEAKRVNDAYKEAMAFSNLQVSYSELDNLSFLSLRIGKIPASEFDNLKDSLGDNAAVVPLGDDKSLILVATSKKRRFALDTELKEVGFVPIDIPSDFKGVPENVLLGLKKQKAEAEKLIEELETERKNYTETHKDKLLYLLGNFSIGLQIYEVEKTLSSTEMVYRITGWLAKAECETYMKDLDNITQSRIAIREYNPLEVPSVISGKEQVPVQLTHGKFVKSYERMIFSYGSPMYGTIDPTPFVAVFFTILFGFMFGDLGQGLVFVLAGILMAKNVIKVGGWNKFAPIFIAIGVTSSLMGLLTGEVFSNETLLEPFSYWITGLFGTPHAPILKMMPSSDPSSIKTMFGVFGAAVAVGFVINSIGLIINFINNLLLKKYDEAFFGKDGLSGALFFWYVVALLIRVIVFKHTVAVYDIVIVAVTLFVTAFEEPFKNLVMHRKPVLENGFGTFVISGLVGLIEVISGYLSNTVSFIRVGAFALSHAVLDFLILTLMEMVGGVGGIAVLIVGNVIIIVLEGMIVAIQAIRLQYYEFFSKFFHETGREFKPFKFVLNTKQTEN